MDTPDGWVLVPINATPEMEQAATAYKKQCGGFLSRNPFTWAGCYAAMVSSRPVVKLDGVNLEFTKLSSDEFDARLTRNKRPEPPEPPPPRISRTRF